MSRFQRFKEKFINMILDHPKKMMGVGFFLFVVQVLGLLNNPQTDFTPRVWFHPKSNQIKDLDLFEKRFGGDQYIALGVFNDQKVISKEFIDTVLELTKELQYLGEVVRVDSISNFNYINTQDDDITISPLIEDSDDLDKVSKRVNDVDEIVDKLELFPGAADGAAPPAPTVTA